MHKSHFGVTKFSFGRDDDIVGVVLHQIEADSSTYALVRRLDLVGQSMHYNVKRDGKIDLIVDEPNVAFHLEAQAINVKTLGINHENSSSGLLTQQTLNAGAQLVADICWRYELGEPTLGKNVFICRDFSREEPLLSCFGSLNYGHAQYVKYMSRAREFYNERY